MPKDASISEIQSEFVVFIREHCVSTEINELDAVFGSRIFSRKTVRYKKKKPNLTILTLFDLTETNVFSYNELSYGKKKSAPAVFRFIFVNKIIKKLEPINVISHLIPLTVWIKNVSQIDESHSA